MRVPVDESNAVVVVVGRENRVDVGANDVEAGTVTALELERTLAVRAVAWRIGFKRVFVERILLDVVC